MNLEYEDEGPEMTMTWRRNEIQFR